MQNLSLKDFADTGLLPAGTSTSATTLHLIESTEFASFHDSLSASNQQWLERQLFTGKLGQMAWQQRQRHRAASGDSRDSGRPALYPA